MNTKSIIVILLVILNFSCSKLKENLIKAQYLELRKHPENALPNDNQFTVFKYEKCKAEIKNPEKLSKCLYLILKDHINDFGIKNIDTLMEDYSRSCSNNAYITELTKIYKHQVDLRRGHLIKPYKYLKSNTLDAHIFYPKDTLANSKYPVIVLIHGGSWSAGKVETQFVGCEYFAKKGIIAVAPEYRLVYRHGTYVTDCIEDVKSLIRWLRKNSAELKIDTSKIVAAGFSAGGHLVACAGIINGFENKNEDLTVSSRPNAMILYNAALIPNNRSYFGGRFLPKGFDKDLIAPYLYIRKGLVPSIILHGTNDKGVKYKTAVAFEKKMKEYGNNCQLFEFEGYGHFLTSTKEGSEKLHKITDDFLESLGYYQK